MEQNYNEFLISDNCFAAYTFNDIPVGKLMHYKKPLGTSAYEVHQASSRNVLTLNNKSHVPPVRVGTCQVTAYDTPTSWYVLALLPLCCFILLELKFEDRW